MRKDRVGSMKYTMMLRRRENFERKEVENWLSFGVKGGYCVSLSSLIMHMQLFNAGFGRQKHQKILWRCAFLAIIWFYSWSGMIVFSTRVLVILRVFKSVMFFLASLWSYASGNFPIILQVISNETGELFCNMYFVIGGHLVL